MVVKHVINLQTVNLDSETRKANIRGEWDPFSSLILEVSEVKKKSLDFEELGNVKGYSYSIRFG